MCNVNWCDNKPDKSGKGYCRMHYDQIRYYGTTTNYRPKGRRNEYLNKGDYTELQILDSNGNVTAIAKVDNEDVDKLKQYSFRYEKDKYIKANANCIYLHQIIMGIDNKLEIDHINRDKLDNRKSNLRQVTHKVNANNKTLKDNTYISFAKHNKINPYKICFKGKYIGYYKTLEEAKKYRDKLLLK